MVTEKPIEKFKPLADLGIIAVPSDYDHATRLSSFRKELGSQIRHNDFSITDEKFSNPSHTLKPGDTLWVCAFSMIKFGKTCADEQIVFLEKKGWGVFVGAQGASLVLEQKRTQLPRGYLYGSLDKRGHLYESYASLATAIEVENDTGYGFETLNCSQYLRAHNAFLGFRIVHKTDP